MICHICNRDLPKNPKYWYITTGYYMRPCKECKKIRRRTYSVGTSARKELERAAEIFLNLSGIPTRSNNCLFDLMAWGCVDIEVKNIHGKYDQIDFSYVQLSKLDKDAVLMVFLDNEWLFFRLVDIKNIMEDRRHLTIGSKSNHGNSRMRNIVNKQLKNIDLIETMRLEHSQRIKFEHER